MAAENPDSQFSSTNLSSTQFPSYLPTAPASPTAESAPAPIPTPAPTPRFQNVRVLLSNTDRTAAHLSRVLATPGGQDSILNTAYYTLLFLHASINTTLESQLEKIASSFAKTASTALNPGETAVVSFQAPPLAANLAKLSASSKMLSAIISDYRMFVRLWGLLGIYSWGKSVYNSPPKDRLLRAIAYSQVGVNLCFQTLENTAWLSSHGITTLEPKKQGQAWLWSAKFWGAHVALDFLRLYRVRSLWGEKEVDAEGKAIDTNSKEFRAKREAEVATWWRQLVVNCCYAPMTVHYSRPEALLTPMQIGTLGIVAGGAGLREMWRKTAI
jgi:hypothetical protein